MPMEATPPLYPDVVLKAAQDQDFRDQLLKDPKATLQAHLGIQFPEGFHVKVVENTPDELTLVIPPKLSDELPDEDLEGIAGGGAFVDWMDTPTGKNVTFSFMTVGFMCAISAAGGDLTTCRRGISQHFYQK